MSSRTEQNHHLTARSTFKIAILLCFCFLECAFAGVDVPKTMNPFAKPVILKHATQYCLGTHCFEASLKAGNSDAYLMGLATRKELWIDIYSAALYLPERDFSTKYGVPTGAKMLVLEYHLKVAKQDVIDSIIDKVTRNPDADEIALRPRFDTFTDGFEAPQKGSRYFFFYDPAVGTSIMKDGRVTVTIPGDDFANAFFGIWLHKTSADQIMRHEILTNVAFSNQ